MHDSTRPNGHQPKRKIATARLRKILVGAAAATVTLTLSAGSPAMAAGSCANADTPANALTQDAAETAVMCLANSERALAGLAPLTRDATLAGDARTLAASSIMSVGLPAMDTALWKPRYTTGTPAPSARDAMTTWMNNPVERAKIVDPRAVLAGAGIFLDKPVDLSPLTKEGNYVLKLGPPPPYIVDPGCPGADVPITATTLAVAEETVVCLTNQERAKQNLAPLAVHSTLTGTARAHSADMVQRRFFDHTNPDGRTQCQRITGAGYPAQCIGSVCVTGRCNENIARATSTTHTPRSFIDGWMNSKPHADTILTPQFKHIGVGIVVGDARGGPGSPGFTATQNFGSPS